jgi:DmsE family decaheme c-type cytochrome
MTHRHFLWGALVTLPLALALFQAEPLALPSPKGEGAVARSQAPAAAPATPAKASQTASTTQARTYVGQDTCLGCHDTMAATLMHSTHAKVQNPNTPAAGQGCESCHGPGSAHVDDPTKPDSIRRFDKMKPREASEACLGCHSNGDHAQWKGSMHDARNLSCTSCHSVHTPKSEKSLLKAVGITETCVGCHTTEVSKLERHQHMPVREGKLTCASCHNPHGSTSVRMLKTGNWINEACTSCHAEKRGPFLWDHAPVREACSTCHDPHGSNNDRMLVAKLPMLCQRCHIGTRHPSTIYDEKQLEAGSNRLIGRSCVNCHSQIHGSNSPSGNAFLR